MPAMSRRWAEERDSSAYVPVKSSDDPGEDVPYTTKPPSTHYRWSGHLFTFVAGILTSAVFFMLVSPRTLQTDEIGSLLSPVPAIPLTTVTFELNETFTDPRSLRTNIAWNALLPPGRGFVFIDEPEQYNLQPGQATEWGDIYSVSVFHQLHCLGQLRKAYWTLIEGVEQDDMRQSRLLLGEHGKHVKHCFDYLRQSIMCAGDMSMEWPREEADGSRIAVDGWGIPHRCKSWDTIMQYMDKAHFNNSMNAQIAP